LYRYEDWWEHDGMHFRRESIDIHRLFEIVKSPQSSLEAMPGDLDVFVGIGPENNTWYLRFYLAWDEEGHELSGGLTSSYKVAWPYCTGTTWSAWISRFRNRIPRVGTGR
jgi:hypothetical protein